MDNLQMLFEMIRDIDKKQDVIAESQIRMEGQIERNTVSLDEHMKRSDNIEKLVHQHKKELDYKIADMKTPFYKKVFTKTNIKWGLGVSSLLLGMYISIRQILSNF